MKSVWPSWPKLSKKIASTRRKLLLLDFDGTLANIADRPEEVVLEKKTRQILSALGRLPDYKLCVISGRSLKNLISFLKLKNIIYAGNHGFELTGAGFSLPPDAELKKNEKRLLKLLAKEMKNAFKKIPGIFIEDKNYTLSLHYRQVPRKYKTDFIEKLMEFKKRYENLPFSWRAGKKVWELRPAVLWGKGNTALYLAGRFPDSLPVIIGDDETDEDMFKALGNRGITIHVGQSGKSKANYYLNSSKDVRKFLQRLIKESRK